MAWAVSLICLTGSMSLGCECAPKTGSGSSPKDPVFAKKARPEENGGTSASTSTSTQTTTSIAANGRAQQTMMTPEQFSRQMNKALGYRRISTVGLASERDHLVSDNALALGGVDFEGAMHRDPTPTVQSLLTIRSMAFSIAEDLVRAEAQRQNQAVATATETSLLSVLSAKQKAALIFSKVDLSSDRPFVEADFALPAEQQASHRAAAERWENQLIDLYWRLLQRPPRADEVAALGKSFAVVAKAEDSPTKAWILTLYGLLVSMEFWNL